MAKKIYFKTYDQNGIYKGVFTDFIFSSFSKTINSGIGELNIAVPRKFDDFGENVTIGFNYEVRIFVYDKEATQGIQIYSGYIAEYRSAVSDSEAVEIRCFGYYSKLALDILKSNSTIAIGYGAGSNNPTIVDPSLMIKNIIDKYRAANTAAKINYSATSITNTTKITGIRFYSQSYLQAIDDIRKQSNFDWYLFAGPDNIVYFKQIPSTATHIFTFGKNVAQMTFNKSIIDMRNGLIFWNGLIQDDPDYISKLYSDSTSISSYGRQIDTKRDGRYKKTSAASTNGGADEYGSRYINTYKEPINNVTMRIIDSNYGNGYDIESINPGDTCRVLNLSNNSVLTLNMVITKVNYNLDYVDIEVADAKQYTARILNDLRNELQDRTYSDTGPMTYI